MDISSSAGALRLQSILRQGNNALSRQIERLSSGLRINHSGDDPSGAFQSVSIGTRARAQQSAVGNLQDACSALSAADAVYGQVEDILQRMRELTVRAGNDATLTTSDLESIQDEIGTLARELTRMAAAHTFNGKHQVAPEGVSPAMDPPSVDNGRVTVTENTVLAGTTFYEDLKTRMSNMFPGAVDMIYGMIGQTVTDSLQVQLHFEDLAFANPLEAIAVTFPAANTIRMEVNLAYFTPQAPFTYPIFGSDPNSAITAEMAFTYNLAQALAGQRGLNILDPNQRWAIFGFTTYAARVQDRLIEWNPAAVTAAIAGALISNPTVLPINPATKTGAQQYAETALAFQFIAENYGNDKIVRMIDYALQGNTFQNAVLRELSQYYTTFAQFEAAVDAWSLDYVNSGNYKNINIGIGRTLATPRPNSPEFVGFVQNGPDNGDSYTLHIPWVAGGSLDYAAMIDVSDTASAGRSLETLDAALKQLSNARQNIGTTYNELQRSVSTLNEERLRELEMLGRITDADMAEEIASYVRQSLTIEAAATILPKAQQDLDVVRNLLEQQDNL